MGVYRLWDILLAAAQNCKMQHLSGQVLAIDASIWLVKANSLFDNDNHIMKCLFDKIIFLKRNNILPLFVFDGISPSIKRKTLQNRRRRRATTNDMQIKKKAQIDVVNLLTQNNNQKDVRLNKKQQKYQQNMKQMDKIFGNLKESQERGSKQISSIELQKMTLQSEVLNSKYELLFQLNPHLKNKLYEEQFYQLDIQSKLQVLQKIQEDKHKISNGHEKKRKLTVEEQILQDMKFIEKKSKIRQLQDNLYRKTMKNCTVVKDGYEIIEGIYNGKKVKQTRKIKTHDDVFKGNSKMKNNFAQILRGEQKKQENNNLDEGPDPFFSELFKKTIKKQSIEQSQESIKSIQITNLTQGLNKQKHKNKNKKKQNKNQSSEFSDQSIKQIKLANNHKSELMEFNNQDKLPAYTPYRHLQLQHMEQNSGYNNFQHFLDILGIPYIISPGEAEAQCASLQHNKIVDGIITEDSDVFLFGGRNIYRGVFQNNIKFYSMDKITQILKFTRQKMIIFAMLLGSDYTDGVKGIGQVNAMQILKVFDTFDKLKQFKKWAQYADILQNDHNNKTQYLSQVSEMSLKYFYQFHQKFKNHWYIDQSFPQSNVYDAYIKPDVLDQHRIQQMRNKKIIQLKNPKTQQLKLSLQIKMEMTQEQIQHYCYLISKQFIRNQQKNIRKFLEKNNTSDNLAVRSKRVRKALDF